MKKFTAYIRLLRPHHWIKNILLFIPLIFSQNLFVRELFLRTVFGFISFSLMASAVYILNDIADIGFDRRHAEKKQRALASGEIKVRAAVLLALLIGSSGLILSWWLGQAFFALLVLYLFANILYSFWFKRLFALNLLLVSSFYLIRIFSGGILATVPVSDLLILTTFFMALFVIATKRSQELDSTPNHHESSLYTPEFLAVLSIVAASAALLFYTQYVLTKPALFFWSLFFVLLVVLRYAYVVFILKKKGGPVVLVLRDPLILLGSFSWVIYVFLLLYIV